MPTTRLLLRELKHARKLGLFRSLTRTLDILGGRVRPSRSCQSLRIVGI